MATMRRGCHFRWEGPWWLDKEPGYHRRIWWRKYAITVNGTTKNRVWEGPLVVNR
jgi:hypothetical protein